MNLQRYFHFFSKKTLFFIYFVVNILLLSQFPFIHSDESWLSGLTRQIMSGIASENPASLVLTEPFFDLLPRFPHFIKMLFHAVQWPFLAVFGYTPLAPRLLSLSAACLALWFFYRAADALVHDSGLPKPLPSDPAGRQARGRPSGQGDGQSSGQRSRGQKRG